MDVITLRQSRLGTGMRERGIRPTHRGYYLAYSVIYCTLIANQGSYVEAGMCLSRNTLEHAAKWARK